MTWLRTLSLAWLIAPTALAAQGVLVAPTGVFINPHTRGASVSLYNPGRTPVEVSISTAFGYPVSDSLGHVTLRMETAPDSTSRSAASWIETFPHRMVMQPSERRVVRLLARPPASLPEGEYWTRLVVSAKGGQVALQSPTPDRGIRVGLLLDVRTIVAVYYRKGLMHTGVTMTGVRAQVWHGVLHVCARFTREGSAAFLGMLHVTVLDSSGTQVASVQRPLAVYYSLSPCTTTAVPALQPGRYMVHLLVDTDRGDLDRAALLPIAAVRDSAALVIVPRTP
ncbi:MAG TPA: hypothetical protein VFW98_11850 [Gemmatimonadaceae bacterium]|nr:hypothetical protein [Gemmatimonadaceae bacterium]